jgi:hypothetical protein
MIYIILIESLAVPSYGGSFPNYKIYFARLLIIDIACADVLRLYQIK